jgi:hypothetical protein
MYEQLDLRNVKHSQRILFDAAEVKYQVRLTRFPAESTSLLTM